MKNNAPTTTITLIDCPVCQQSISTQATACPHCGQPLSKARDSTVFHQNPVQTIEKTSKRLKLQGLVFAMLLIGGTVFSFVGVGSETQALTAVSGLSIFIGLVGYFITRVEVWWQHK